MSDSKQGCGCEESKALKAELLNSQLELQVVRRALARVIGIVDAALDRTNAEPGGDVNGYKITNVAPPSSDDGIAMSYVDGIERDAKTQKPVPAPGSIGARAVDWIASRMPKSERP